MCARRTSSHARTPVTPERGPGSLRSIAPRRRGSGNAALGEAQPEQRVARAGVRHLLRPV
jgi:hypothetical protein